MGSRRLPSKKERVSPMIKAAYVLVAALLASLFMAAAPPAAHAASPHIRSNVCVWTVDDNWNAGTAPMWSQVDWESSQCIPDLQLQQGSWCATRTGSVLVTSGIVVNLEIEARATCTNQQRLVKCAYRVNPGNGWGDWESDCNPPITATRR